MENFKIIEEKKNPLFNRKEIKFSVDAKITPSHADARKIISEKFSTPEENIRIKNILGKFGSKTFTISANIYSSEQDKLDTEGKSKKDAVAQPEQTTETPEVSTEQPKLPEPVQEAPTQDTTTPESSKPGESINKPNKSNEPASEQSKESKPEEKKE